MRLFEPRSPAGASYALKQHSALYHSAAVTAVTAVPQSLPCPSGVPLPAHFLPAHTFATASADGTVRFWRLSSATTNRQRNMFSKDMLHCVRVTSSSVAQTLPAALSCLVTSADGAWLAVADASGCAHVLSVGAMAVVAVIDPPAPDCAVHAMLFSPAGHLWVGYADHAIRVFSIVAAPIGRLLAAFTLHAAPISSMTLSPDGVWLFSCDAAGGLVVSRVTAEVGTGAPLLHRHTGGQCSAAVTHAAMDRAGVSVATVGSGGGVQIWGLKRLASPLRVIKCVAGGLRAVCVHCDL